MIQTKIQFNLKNAKQYCREHLGAGHYYSEGQKMDRMWLGFGAEKLGLRGPVGEDSLLAQCERMQPETGLRMGQQMYSVRHEGDGVEANRRAFFAFTIAPPKCVSVVGLYQDERVLALQEQAVRQATFELGKRAEMRVRILGPNGERRAILLERPELGMGLRVESASLGGWRRSFAHRLPMLGYGACGSERRRA